VAYSQFLYDETSKGNYPPPCYLPREISLTSVTYPSYIVTPTYVAKFETEQEDHNPVSELLGGGAKKRRLHSIQLYRRNATSGEPPADLGTPLQQSTFNYGWSGTYDERRSVLLNVTISAGDVTLFTI